MLMPPLPRCIPHTAKATAAITLFSFLFCFSLLPSLLLSLFFPFFTDNPVRCRDNFTALPGDFPRHIHDNHAHSGDPPAMWLLTRVFLETLEEQLSRHWCLRKHGEKLSAVMWKAELKFLLASPIVSSCSWTSLNTPTQAGSYQRHGYWGNHALPARVS